MDAREASRQCPPLTVSVGLLCTGVKYTCCLVGAIYTGRVGLLQTVFESHDQDLVYTLGIWAKFRVIFDSSTIENIN